MKNVLRNGYIACLDFNKNAERLEGISSFFRFLNISSGETLLFEHCGGFQFKVHIFNMYGSEIEHPTMHNIDADLDGMYLIYI